MTHTIIDTYEVPESQRCPHWGEDCCGRLHWRPAGDCSCHISAPCPACHPGIMVCDICGEEIACD